MLVDWRRDCRTEATDGFELPPARINRSPPVEARTFLKRSLRGAARRDHDLRRSFKVRVAASPRVLPPLEAFRDNAATILAVSDMLEPLGHLRVLVTGIACMLARGEEKEARRKGKNGIQPYRRPYANRAISETGRNYRP